MHTKEIQVSDIGSEVLTILFLNLSHDPPTKFVWVSQNVRVHRLALADLQSKPHIEIMQEGLCHFHTE